MRPRPANVFQLIITQTLEFYPQTRTVTGAQLTLETRSAPTQFFKEVTCLRLRQLASDLASWLFGKAAPAQH